MLELRDFRQAGDRGVRINEELVFHFSADLDRTSITSDSVRIFDSKGRPAAGEFFVRRSTLEFRPDLPRRADLADGGLLPSESYTVELAGFPRPDGVRGRRGEVLSSTLRLPFHTVELGGDAPLFLDPFSDRLAPLLPLATRLGPLDPIRLQCGEALDPTSVVAAAFELRGFRQREDQQGRTVDELERIPVRVELVENRRDAALVHLRPAYPGRAQALGGLRALPPGEYFLHAPPGAPRLRNLGQRPVETWGPLPLPLQVVQPGIGSERLTFDDVVRRGPEEVEGADGTAWWGGGRIGVRFPLSAGDGRDGLVEDWSGQTDVHATRLRVPAGEDWDLSGARGLVVLRAQGTLEILGHLRRRVDPKTPAMGETFRGPDRRFLADAGTLVDWLDEAARANHDWTVLVAGGDLRVPGDLEVDGPLMLIAGGWIRIRGRVEASEVWHSAGGGQNIVSPEPARVAPLRFTEPTENPLRAPLRLAVLSTPVRPEHGVVHWRGAEVVGDSGNGSFGVRFLGVRDVTPREVQIFGPFDNMVLLGDCPAIRLLIELELQPGGRWDPPRVDEIEVSWTEPFPR